MTSRPALSRSSLRWWLALMLVSVVFGLAGCAAGPDYRGPDTMPVAAFTSRAGIATDAPVEQWWRQFADQELDHLVDTSLRDNPDLAAAEALVRRARAAASVAGAARLPSVNVAGRVSDDKLSRNGESLALIPISPRTTQFTDYRLGIDASWEIDLAGRTRRDVEAAVARLGSAQETRNDARLIVASEVAASYVDARVSEARLAVARDRRAASAEIRRLVELQRKAGIVGDDDFHRAQADAAVADSSVPPLESSLEASVFGLAALTGIPADEIRLRLVGHPGIPQAPRSVPVGLSSEVLKRRPDVRRAERELAAATADVGSAVAAQFPRFSLVADAGLDSVRSGELASAASRYWNVAPQLSVPLFAGGRLRGQVKAAEAARDAAVASYRGSVARALSDVESSFVRYAAARARSEAADTAAVALDATVENVERRRTAGDASSVDVLVAKRASDDTREQQIIAVGDASRSYIAVNRALGGGWQSGQASAGR